MIDFNAGTEKPNMFLGAEKKTTILYNNELYMIKYPDPVRGTKLLGQLSYKNNQYSEYIGCKIFKLCGLNAQDVVLGFFTDNDGKEKIVAGCKVFTNNNTRLLEFKMLGNQERVNEEKLGLDLNGVVSLIESSRFIEDKASVRNSFWDMFVVDALIGNRDRHLGNFGMLEKDGKLEFAPIYDCGSSLCALLDDDSMAIQQENSEKFQRELKMTEYNVTTCYTKDGKKIFYHEIFKNPPEELAAAILRIVPRIDMEAIRQIVDSTPTMSEIRKTYLKAAMDLRYGQIIAPAYKRLSLAKQFKPLADAIDSAITGHMIKDAAEPGKVQVDMASAVKAVLNEFDRGYVADALKSKQIAFNSAPALIEGFVKRLDEALAGKPSMDERYAEARRRKQAAEAEKQNNPSTPKRTTPEL